MANRLPPAARHMLKAAACYIEAWHALNAARSDGPDDALVTAGNDQRRARIALENANRHMARYEAHVRRGGRPVS